MGEYDKKQQSLFQRLRDELKAGTVSRMFREKYRIADPDTSQAQTGIFSAYMQGLMQKVLGADYDPEKHNFRFMIAVDSKPNAGIIDEASPPIIMFSTGLLARLKTEDQLAGVLAHELTHFSIASEANSKVEELAADVWPVYALRRAGYNPKALIEALDIIAPKKEEADIGTMGGALSYLDPHPKTPLRKRTMENALFVMARDEGVNDFNITDTPANTDMMQAVRSCVHTSHIGRMAAAAGYGDMDDSAKLLFVAGLIPEALGPSLRFHTERIEDVKNLLYDLPLSVEDEENEAALGTLVDKILELKDDELSFAQTTFYQTLSENISTAFAKVGPRLNRLDGSFRDFVYARDPDRAEAAAAQIGEDTRDFTFPGGQQMWRMNWTEFSLPPDGSLHRAFAQIEAEMDGGDAKREAALQEKYGVTPPWERHVGWAIERNSVAMAQTLISYGIKDPRLLRAFDGRLKPPREWNQNNSKYDNLVFGQQGRIIGTKDSYKENLEQGDKAFNAGYVKRLDALETRRAAGLARRAEALLQPDTVDWKLLEQGDDFSAFLAKYREFAEPQLTRVPVRADFAAALVTHIEELLAKDPEKYRPVVKKFFSGITYDPESFDYRRKGHETEPVATLNDMLHDATKSENWRLNWNYGTTYALRMGIGADPASPYTRFVLEDKHGLFDTAAKLEHMKYTRFMHLANPSAMFRDPPVADTGNFLFDIDLRDLLGYKAPKTAEETLAAIDLLQTHQYPDRNKQGLLIQILYQQKSEACEFLEANKAPLPPAQYGRFASLAENSYGAGQPFEGRLAAALDAQLKINSAYELSAEAPLETLAAAYTTYVGREMFVRMPELRRQYDAALSERLAALDDPGMKKAITEQLLYNARIDDPQLRQQLVQGWVDAERALRGPDDESEGYRDSITALMATVLGKAKGYVAFSMMSTLATDVEAQETLAFAIRDGLKDHLKKSATESGGNALGIATEFGLAALSKHTQGRQYLLEFLTTPLTDASAKQFHDRLEPMLNDVKTRGRAAHLDFYRAVMNTTGYSEATEQQKLAGIHLAHKNFWSLPLEGRTFFIEKILFPPDEETQTGFQNSFNFVLQGIFPYGNKYSDLGREIVHAYLDSVPVYSQRLMLSALMVAREQSGEAQTEQDVGRTLALVLVNLGPAGVKLAQAIHSHPDTPDSIRSGMHDVKGRADLPFRWDIFSRINDVLPPEEKSAIARVGKLLGGGSFQYTLETLKKSGIRTALSLLRRNVRPRAETEFQHFAATAATIIGLHPEFAPLSAIIAQARNNVPLETDYDLGRKQSDIATAAYDGFAVTVRGRVFNFTTVDWLGHGTEYKESSVAPGLDYNDLPAKTDEQIRHKHDVAEAVVTAELYMILSGRRFDYDRHGSNLKVDGNTVTGFDFGGMALEPPTLEEKQLLGKALAEAYKISRRGKVPFGSALVTSLSKNAGAIEGSDYLASVERGVLALGDYINVLTTRETENIASSLSKAGLIDRDIMASAKKHMGLGALSVAFIKGLWSKPDGIDIREAATAARAPSGLKLAS